MNNPKEEVEKEEVIEKNEFSFMDIKLKVAEILNENQFDEIY
jgi:hypothetical protein